MKELLIKAIRFYKNAISPVAVLIFGHSCRFTPTCSEYTINALEEFGVAKGLLMGAKRILRCHPWGGFGYDPVPSQR